MTFNKILLEELCTVITDGSHSSPKAVEKGYKMLSVKDMGEFDFNYENSKEISKDDYLKLVAGNCQPKVNDVLIAKDGNSCLEYCFVYREQKEVVLLSSIAILRPDTSKINPYYLMYYLGTEKAKKELKEGYLSGSAIPRVVLKDFKKYPLFVPNIEVQNKIVKLIGSINSKIENNLRIINNLEGISQTIFKHWFIDFEFPSLEGLPYKTSGGKMVNSELGEIPIGWSISYLDKVANYKNGLAMQKYRPLSSENESLPVLKIKELNQGFVDSNSDRCSKLINEEVKVFDGDVIFSWSGTLLIKLWTGGNAGLNQHLFKVTSKEYEKWFYYLWTNYHLRKFKSIAADKATTMGHIKRTHLSESEVYIADKRVMDEATKVLNPLLEKIILLGVENRKLAKLRDSLLPKLLSGEIEIPDESVVG